MSSFFKNGAFTVPQNNLVFLFSAALVRLSHASFWSVFILLSRACLYWMNRVWIGKLSRGELLKARFSDRSALVQEVSNHPLFSFPGPVGWRVSSSFMELMICLKFLTIKLGTISS